MSADDPTPQELADGFALWQEHRPQSADDWLGVARRCHESGEEFPNASPLFAALLKATVPAHGEGEVVERLTAMRRRFDAVAAPEWAGDVPDLVEMSRQTYAWARVLFAEIDRLGASAAASVPTGGEGDARVRHEGQPIARATRCTNRECDWKGERTSLSPRAAVQRPCGLCGSAVEIASPAPLAGGREEPVQAASASAEDGEAREGHRLRVSFDGEDAYWKIVCPPGGGCQIGTHCGGCGRNLVEPDPDFEPSSVECYDCKGVTAAYAEAAGCALANADMVFATGEVTLSVESVAWDPEEGPTVEVALPPAAASSVPEHERKAALKASQAWMERQRQGATGIPAATDEASR